MTNDNLATEMGWRNAIFDATPGALDILTRDKIVAYNGFDPSAASFHIGNLVPIMGLVRLQRHGHSPIGLIGGGTGMIGDPGGRNDERPLLTLQQVEENVVGLRAQMEKFLDFKAKSNPARLVNNAEWLMCSNTIEFMRDIGKHFSVNYMLQKDSVKGRMSNNGISFTEFGYMLLQAYDFQILHDQYGCTYQMGGSDQWGNILAGVDLLRRTRNKRVHGVVYPLITLPSGAKIGKSTGGAAWLDPDLTSPYRLYQYLFNADDKLVIDYLKLYTLHDQETIDEMQDAVTTKPAQRAAQRLLARSVVNTVHGTTELSVAERASEVLFGGEIEGIAAKTLEEIFADVPSSNVPRTSLEGDGVPLIRLMVVTNLVTSTGEARRLTEQGGIYVNNKRVNDPRHVVTIDQVIKGQVLVLRRGAKNYHLIRIT